MLSYDFLIDRSLFLNMVCLLKSYIILLKERKHYCISFYDLNKLCDRAVRGLALQNIDPTDPHALLTLFRDYFQAIDFSLEDFLPNYLFSRNRCEFEKSPIYDLAQNIVNNCAKELPFHEDSTLAYRRK